MPGDEKLGTRGDERRREEAGISDWEHTAPSASFSFPSAKFNLERVQLHLFAPADWYEETKPRKITRKMYVLRVRPAEISSPGTGRQRIRNFTNSDSRI